MSSWPVSASHPFSLVNDYVVCRGDSGHIIRAGKRERFASHFPLNSVGIVRGSYDEQRSVVYIIGQDATYTLKNTLLEDLDIFQTGDDYEYKICNICHVLKPTASDFVINQTNIRRSVTRPSCKVCRRHIEQRSMSKREREEAERHRPSPGILWRCPICRKQSIVGVTAKIVLDHRHSTGTARSFLCDSCNTGLGRFKNGENYLKNALAYLAEFENSNK